jgi:hypothetical protein
MAADIAFDSPPHGGNLFLRMPCKGFLKWGVNSVSQTQVGAIAEGRARRMNSTEELRENV